MPGRRPTRQHSSERATFCLPTVSPCLWPDPFFPPSWILPPLADQSSQGLRSRAVLPGLLGSFSGLRGVAPLEHRAGDPNEVLLYLRCHSSSRMGRGNSRYRLDDWGREYLSRRWLQALSVKLRKGAALAEAPRKGRSAIREF